MKPTLYILLVPIFLVSCGSKNPQGYEPDVLFSAPEYFGAPAYSNDANTPTVDRFELGRKLFYDPILSADSTQSCASCHRQHAGFSDPGVAISPGISGTTPGPRNAPALANLAWFPNYMMDGGITNLEVMPFAPITSAHEMNADMATVVSAVQQRADYRAAFNRAFDEDTVTSQRIFYALAIFQSGMISANSRWDQRERGELVFSDVELWGEGLFVENCASCHPAPFFTDWTYVNVGLDSITDPGRYLVSQDSADYSAFKVPSLRNVVLSPPYFHDGRAATLEQAVNHFTAFEGGGGMDQRLLDMRELDKDEKLALLSFLHTLTDYSYTTNPLFEKP